MEVLHPPIVHFTIALTITGIIFEVLWFTFKRDIFNAGALLNLGFAVIFAWLAFFTGHLDEEKAEKLIENTPAYNILEYHETLGLIVAIAITLLGILKIFNYLKPSNLLRVFILVLGLITFVLVILQGNLGGRLVYDYGVGVKPVMEGLR
ncbi:DUF2231 domain-containing protein [Aquifex aeolicus]|uniref:DUF2231 domain-containing protein n=1 Tax=Aquifex aeolicus (strain VF5) TaxID=224324 RepID=O66993_AQUAE|nr:DUF2231 domain-containing protein [Aquifex aeolicus]AAC06957.1 putative protein [Aquifex aeolicus VF5]